MKKWSFLKFSDILSITITQSNLLLRFSHNTPVLFQFFLENMNYGLFGINILLKNILTAPDKIT